MVIKVKVRTCMKAWIGTRVSADCYEGEREV